MDEWVKVSSPSNPVFALCCHHGKISLDAMDDPPKQLSSLYMEQSTEAKAFRENICRYNSALAFTSFLAKETQDVNSEGSAP